MKKYLILILTLLISGYAEAQKKEVFEIHVGDKFIFNKIDNENELDYDYEAEILFRNTHDGPYIANRIGALSVMEKNKRGEIIKAYIINVIPTYDFNFVHPQTYCTFEMDKDKLIENLKSAKYKNIYDDTDNGFIYLYDSSNDEMQRIFVYENNKVISIRIVFYGKNKEKYIGYMKERYQWREDNARYTFKGGTLMKPNKLLIYTKDDEYNKEPLFLMTYVKW